MSQPYTSTQQEYFPGQKGSKIRMPGGINMCAAPPRLSRMICQASSASTPGPGAFHLHSNEKRELEEYAREMCAEAYDDEQHAWVNPHSRAYHYWDCEVMCKALAYILNVRNTSTPARREKTQTSSQAWLTNKYNRKNRQLQEVTMEDLKTNGEGSTGGRPVNFWAVERPDFTV